MLKVTIASWTTLRSPYWPLISLFLAQSKVCTNSLVQLDVYSVLDSGGAGGEGDGTTSPEGNTAHAHPSLKLSLSFECASIFTVIELCAGDYWDF